jgi:rod shape-determining protein MreD
MSGFEAQLVGPVRSSGSDRRWRPLALVLLSLGAILFQVYVPIFFSYLSYLELPLLLTVHFALVRRSPVAGLLYGGVIGLLQDALSSLPLGMYSIVKTLVGFFAAHAGMRMDADNAAIRFLFGSGFFLAHQLVFFALSQALIGAGGEFDVGQVILFALLNGAVAAPLFQLLDKL